MREDALNFEGATLAANNLGGMGPVTSDPAELRLSGVTLGSATMDFVITNLTRYYGVPTKKVAVNGMRGEHGSWFKVSSASLRTAPRRPPWTISAGAGHPIHTYPGARPEPLDGLPGLLTPAPDRPR
jgi:hypothetical protein